MRGLFDINTYDFDGGRVAVLKGELDASTCRELGGHLSAPPGSLFVLDLDELTFLDSSGLGAIHVARRTAIENGGDLVLCRPTPIVYRVLEITGLDNWVTDWDPQWSKSSAVESRRTDLVGP